MKTENSQGFEDALFVASNGIQSEDYSFQRAGETIRLGRFFLIGENTYEFHLADSINDKDRRQEVMDLVCYISDLYGITLFSAVADHASTLSDQAFLIKSGFIPGRAFPTGSLPFCRLPKSIS